MVGGADFSFSFTAASMVLFWTPDEYLWIKKSPPSTKSRTISVGMKSVPVTL